MTTKILVNTTLKKLIKNINFEEVDKYSNDTLDQYLSNFSTKYKANEHFLDNIVLKLVVNNEYKAVENFNSRDITYYYDAENIILLNKIFVLHSNYREKEITLCFIIDEEENLDYCRFEDYVTKYSICISNNHNNHKAFEDSIKDKKSIVKGTRKSILNSVFGTNSRKPFRILTEKEYIDINSIRDTFENKYLNLQCPICSSFDKNSRKYEINTETINDIIKIERNTSRISFNCLHKLYDLKGGKFFIIPLELNVDMIKYKDLTLQIWALKNFNFIVKMKKEESELNENN